MDQQILDLKNNYVLFEFFVNKHFISIRGYSFINLNRVITLVITLYICGIIPVQVQLLFLADFRK